MLPGQHKLVDKQNFGNYQNFKLIIDNKNLVELLMILMKKSYNCYQPIEKIWTSH